jgi:site-specific DNA-methyltransferase (adenine-specific)
MIQREEIIGDCRLILGDCLEVMPGLGKFDHILMDPPYEASLHASKNSAHGPTRTDTGPDLKGLDFAPIDEIRASVVALSAEICSGWFLAFCTVEGVAKWADAINLSAMKYKRACIWVKPDSTPQLNGQGPAQGAECFVAAWAGTGHAKWNAGGKRGVYTHCVNQRTREGTHPTEKPVSLMAELLLDFTKYGGSVLDPFMGSGTTGVSCVALGRSFVGIEKEPAYFDVACRRIEAAYQQPRLFEAPAAKPVQEQISFGEDGA